MRRWSIVAVAGLAVAAVIVAAVSGRHRPSRIQEAASRPTIVRDDALLLGGPPARVAAAERELAVLGTDWVRVTADWSAIAPRRPTTSSGARDPRAYPPRAWARLDTAVRLARANGMRAMVDIAGRPPRWALARDGAGIDAAAFGRFAQAVARRYSGRFEGLPAAVAFGVWNEPNRPASLGLPPGPTAAATAAAAADRYRAMIYAAVPVIHRVAPRSRVLLGNTAATGSLDTVAPLRFVRRLACVSARGPLADGPCRRFAPLPGDGWAHHPYSVGGPPWSPRASPDDVPVAGLGRLSALLGRLRSARRLARGMPVYVTEYGYPTAPPATTAELGVDGPHRGMRATGRAAPGPTPPGPAIGLYQQARWLGEAEWLAFFTPGVRGFAQAPLRDGPDSAAGLELAGGLPKPAREAFSHTLVVHTAGLNRVRLWGHLRPARGPERYRVSVRMPDGSWRPLPLFNRGKHTDEHGYFLVDARTAPGGTLVDPRGAFRLEILRKRSGWDPVGLPIFGASSPPALAAGAPPGRGPAVPALRPRPPSARS